MPDTYRKYIVDSPGCHVRRSSRRHATRTLASNDIYNCTELLEKICSHCDWNSLVRMGNISPYLRVVVQDIIRRRIIFGLDRFIPKIHHTRFFELLESTAAAIVGGFIRHIMCLEEEVYRAIFPSQLSIVVPIGILCNLDASRKWLHFISNCGEYERTWDNDTSLPYSASSSTTFFFNRLSSNIQISLVVCEDDNIFSTLIYAPETSLFNILTSRRIHSFYPSLFAEHVNLETSTAHLTSRLRNSIRPFRFGFTTYDDAASAYLFLPCREGCYALTRNILKMEGISRFRWGGIKGKYDRDDLYGEQSPKDPFELLDIEWRIGTRCRNSTCKYYRFGFIG